MNDTTIGDVISAGFPNATHDDMEDILWGRTPFPFTKVTAKELYKVSFQFYRASKNGLRLCDFCNDVALPNDTLCHRCAASWKKTTEEMYVQSRARLSPKEK